MLNRGKLSMIERFDRYGIALGQAAANDLSDLFERLDLSDLDLMTIRDLMRYAPAPDDAALIRILGMMLAAKAMGSLCLRLDVNHLAEFFPQWTDATGWTWLPEFKRSLKAGRYDDLIDRSGGDDFKPLIFDDTKNRRLLYFQKFRFHEQRLKQRLEDLLRYRGHRELSDAVIETVVAGLYADEAVIRTKIGGDPIVKDPFQVAAIHKVLMAPFLVVSGGPGTGKTSLLVNMLRALIRTGTDPSRIVLAAPTGRAAQRMTEALTVSLATVAQPDPRDRMLGNLSGATLHKVLVYQRRTGGFMFGRNRPLIADVVAVDEVSMVDVVMMDHLFQAIDPTRTQVILMGDKDQLPSVEAGSVLADLSPMNGSNPATHFVSLPNGYRSSGQLFELAQAINAGARIVLEPVDFRGAMNMQSGGWAFVTNRDGATLAHDLDHWTVRQYVARRDGCESSYVDLVQQYQRQASEDESMDRDRQKTLMARIFRFAYQCRVLTVLRHGPSGMQAANQRIAAELRRLLDPTADPDQRAFHGAWIMIARNDYTRGLFNGDVGVVLKDPRDGMYYAHFKRAEGTASYFVASLPEWELAFAMTVHKSQGSEFDDTLLLLPDDPSHRLLTREIVYTAATRASHRMIVYGTEGVFQAALQRKIQRQSGLLI